MPDRAGMLHPEGDSDRNPPHQHSRGPHRRSAEPKQQQHLGRRHATRSEAIQYDQQQSDHRGRLALSHSQLQRTPFGQFRDVGVTGDGEHLGIQTQAIRIEQRRRRGQLQHQHVPTDLTVAADRSDFAAANRQVEPPSERHARQQHQANQERTMQIGPRREQCRHREPMPRSAMSRRHQRQQKHEAQHPRHLRPHDVEMLPATPEP